MLTAKDLMTKKIVSIAPNDSMLEASQLMSIKTLKHLVVKKDNKLVGILSDRDLFKSMRSELVDSTRMELSLNSTQKVKDYMSWPVYVVSETTSIKKIIEEFLLQRVSAFIVENKKGEIKGIITIDDVLKYSLLLIQKNEKNNFHELY